MVREEILHCEPAVTPLRPGGQNNPVSCEPAVTPLKPEEEGGSKSRRGGSTSSRKRRLLQFQRRLMEERGLPLSRLLWAEARSHLTKRCLSQEFIQCGFDARSNSSPVLCGAGVGTGGMRRGHGGSHEGVSDSGYIVPTLRHLSVSQNWSTLPHISVY